MNAEIQLTVKLVILYLKLMLESPYRSCAHDKVVMVREQRGIRDVTDEDAYGDMCRCSSSQRGKWGGR